MGNKPTSYKSLKGYFVTFFKYTREEIRDAWVNDAQGHAAALRRDEYCVVEWCPDLEDAYRLSALFLRLVIALPGCLHWDGKTLSMNCAEGGNNAVSCLERCRAMVAMYRSGIVDEHGPLFADQACEKEGTADVKKESD